MGAVLLHDCFLTFRWKFHYLTLHHLLSYMFSLQTTLYRDLKLRAALIKDKKLVLLPGEVIHESLDGVWNLSSDQGNLGTFYITNIRVVWHANLAENFNVTIPFLQMRTMTVRPSKFGPALVINTRAATGVDKGGYLLGFRIHPHERLDSVFLSLSKLYSLYAGKPKFGISFTVEEVPRQLEAMVVERKEDTLTITDENYGGEAFAAYAIARGTKDEHGKESDPPVPVFDDYLGLATERLEAGFTTKGVWSF